METIGALIAFLLGFVLTLSIREKMLQMIVNSGFTRPNFKGCAIPLSAGVIFFIVLAPASIPFILLGDNDIRGAILLYLFAAAGASLLGIMDDFWGARDISGLLGHFKALAGGKLTTGAVKALGGGLLALAVGAFLFPGQPWRILDSALIIALSTNMLNLFDLRPGRAGKMFILLYLALVPFFAGTVPAVPASIIFGSLLAFLPADIKARAMMGDAGSNTLGVVIGVTAAASLDGYYRVGFMTMLILIHVITEKYSLTRIIAANKVLHFLDMLGREKGPGR